MPQNEGAPASSEGPRPTPYELALAAAGVEDDVFPAIVEEAGTRDVDARDPERFILLGSVGAVLRELLAPAPDAAAPTPAGELLGEAARLLYHGYHFWRAGRPFFVVDADVVRSAVAQPPSIGAWHLDLPADAGYLQLPRHLIWARAVEGAAPEAVDGFFWTVRERDDGDVRALDVLLVLGMRPGRPGFSVVDVAGRLPPGGAAGWAASRARAEGGDFANILPGGEIDGLLALTTSEEVLKLAEILFWIAAHQPSATAPAVEPAAAAAPDNPSTLPARRIHPPDAGG